MRELPWIILGKRYRYQLNNISFIFVFTSYDKINKVYYFNFKREESDIWENTFWHSRTLEHYKHLFTCLDRPKIEDDPEYKELFV